MSVRQNKSYLIENLIRRVRLRRFLLYTENRERPCISVFVRVCVCVRACALVCLYSPQSRQREFSVCFSTPYVPELDFFKYATSCTNKLDSGKNPNLGYFSQIVLYETPSMSIHHVKFEENHSIDKEITEIVKK